MKRPAVKAAPGHFQENCKVGVWSIFRTIGHESTERASAENMDLTPSFWTLQFS